MKLLYIIFIIHIAPLFCFYLKAAPLIKNINIASNETDGIITISYDISNIQSSAEVVAKASIDNGVSYSIDITTALGSLGSGISNGTGKQISWSAKDDLPYGGPFQMKIQLNAKEEGELINEDDNKVDESDVEDVVDNTPNDSDTSSDDSSSNDSELDSDDGNESENKNEEPEPATQQTLFTVSSSYKIPVTGCKLDHPLLMYDDGEIQLGKKMAFTDNGDGTITDTNTGLMWIVDYNFRNEEYRYQDPRDANQTISELTYAGFSDWRLPTQREMHFIMKMDDTPLKLDYASFKSLPIRSFFTSESVNGKKFNYSNTYDCIVLKNWGKAEIYRFNPDNFNPTDPLANATKKFNFLSTGTQTWDSVYYSNNPFVQSTYLSDIQFFFTEHIALAVRGVDKSLPNLTYIGDEIYDSNNELRYKEIEITDEDYTKTIEGLSVNSNIQNFYLKTIERKIYKENNYPGYRLPNINELLNLSVGLKEVWWGAGLSSTISPHSDLSCSSEIKPCSRGFFELELSTGYILPDGGFIVGPPDGGSNSTWSNLYIIKSDSD